MKRNKDGSLEFARDTTRPYSDIEIYPINDVNMLVSNPYFQTVQVYDFRSGHPIIHNCGNDIESRVIHTQGKYVILWSGTGRLTCYDVTSLERIWSLRSIHCPDICALNRDQTYCVALYPNTNNVTVINIQKGSTTKFTTHVRYDGTNRIHSYLGYVYVVNRNSIYNINTIINSSTTLYRLDGDEMFISSVYIGRGRIVCGKNTFKPGQHTNYLVYDLSRLRTMSSIDNIIREGAMFGIGKSNILCGVRIKSQIGLYNLDSHIITPLNNIPEYDGGHIIPILNNKLLIKARNEWVLLG